MHIAWRGSSICKAELDKGIARRKERLPGAIGVFALAPISVAWLLTHVIVWTVRWIKRESQPRLN